MRIFSKHRRKIEPHRRFGSREFRSKLKRVQEHKRVFLHTGGGFFSRLVPRLSFKSKALRFVLLAIFALSFHYLVISDKFLITEVTAANNQEVSIEQVQQVLDAASNSRTFLIKRNHYLFMSHGRVNELITSAIPDVKEVTSSNRKGLNKIELVIRERSPGFVFIAKSRKFLVDEDGNIVKEVTETKDLPVVLDQVDEDVVVGELLPNPKLIAFVISMNRSWKNKINSAITAIKVPGKGAGEAQFESQEGWSAFFDVNRSVTSQLDSLAVILSKQIPAKDRGRLAYIDLRSEKWIYFCYKETPCAATEAQATEGEQQ